MKFYEVLILTNILGIDYLSISLIFYFLWGGGWELRHIIDSNGVEYKKRKTDTSIKELNMQCRFCLNYLNITL